VLKRVAKELGSPRVAVAEELEQVAHEAIAKKSEGHSWTNVEYWSAVVLDVAEVPPALAPAMFACSRTAGWSAHILEQKRLGVLVRPSAKYVGPPARSLQGV
jgi:citrate synthase